MLDKSYKNIIIRLFSFSPINIINLKVALIVLGFYNINKQTVKLFDIIWL